MKGFLIIALVLTITGVDQINLPKYAQKKVTKQLEDLYPNQDLNLKSLQLPVGKSSGTQLFSIKSGGVNKGYLYLDEAPSKFENFNFMVIFNNDLTIKNVEVLIYREDYGGEIGSRRWLRQFEGKSAGKDMEYSDDIVGISGATISCKSITQHIKHLSLDMQEFKRLGII